MTFIKVIKRLTAAFAVFAALWALPFSSLALPPVINDVQPEAQPKKTRQIVILVVDGLQADSVSSAGTPSISGLGMAGVRVDRVSVMPPESAESRLHTLLSGCDPEENIKPDGSGLSSLRPTILYNMEKKGIKTAVIDGTGNLDLVAAGSTHKYFGPFQNDGEIIDKAVELIKSKKPFITVVVLAGPGKSSPGPGTKQNPSAVSASDTQLGRLIKHLHVAGTYEETLIVVSGTTGRPPLIIKGNEFLPGTKLPPVCLKDLAPTIGYLFGINMPEAGGQVLWNALKPGPDRSENFMLQQRIMDLSTAYARAVESAARLENEKIAVQNEKVRLAGEKQTVENEIAQRDGEIKKLNNTISIIKITGLFGILVFIATILIEYRILKKKYLFFT